MQISIITRIFVFTAVAVLSFVFVGFAYANPSYFANGVTTNSSATTSPAFMTPGTGTSTTPVYDSYTQTTNGGVTSKADSAGMLTVFCGSSTLAVLNIAVEYSQDNIDWFRNFLLTASQMSTTTVPYAIVSPFATKWQFASSTIGSATLNSICSTASLHIPTPFRYMRVVNTITGANGSIWENVVPTKEIK